MADIFDMVDEFATEVLGMPFPAKPKRLSHERKAWALTALQEELTEYGDVFDVPESTGEVELAEEADALLDLMYFAAGRLREMGIPKARIRASLAAIHAANMAKKRGELSKRPGAQGYDAVKPPGWRAPNLHKIIFPGKPKLIVIGHARHGKDTVAELLRDEHGYAFQSSSLFCAERIIMASPEFAGKYATPQECYDDRVNHRQAWFDLIAAYNQPDRARLSREQFEQGDLVVGVRHAEELQAAAGLARAVIWVDGSQRHPPEDRVSCTVEPWMADFVLDNNGTLEELEVGLSKLVKHIESTY